MAGVMLRRAAVLCTLLVSGCAPAEDPAPLSGGDQGTAGAAVDIALEVRVSASLRPVSTIRAMFSARSM